MQTRKYRKNGLQIWLTDRELAMLQEIQKETGLNKSEILRRSIYILFEKEQTI